MCPWCFDVASVSPSVLHHSSGDSIIALVRAFPLQSPLLQRESQRTAPHVVGGSDVSEITSPVMLNSSIRIFSSTCDSRFDGASSAPCFLSEVSQWNRRALWRSGGRSCSSSWCPHELLAGCFAQKTRTPRVSKGLPWLAPKMQCRCIIAHNTITIISTTL